MASCLLILCKTKKMNLLVKQTSIGEMLEAAAADTTITGYPQLSIEACVIRPIMINCSDDG